MDNTRKARDESDELRYSVYRALADVCDDADQVRHLMVTFNYLHIDIDAWQGRYEMEIKP